MLNPTIKRNLTYVPRMISVGTFCVDGLSKTDITVKYKASNRLSSISFFVFGTLLDPTHSNPKSVVSLARWEHRQLRLSEPVNLQILWDCHL